MQKPLQSLYFFTFFLSIQYAFTAYVNSTFLESFVSTKAVGLIYTLSAILGIVGLLVIPKILTKYCNHKILFSLVLISLISLFGLFASTSTALTLVFFFLYLISNYLVVFSRDIFAEGYSQNETTGKTRGLLLTTINLGWVFAPLASGIVIKYFGYSQMYLLAAIFMFIAFLYVLGPIRKLKDLEFKPVPIKQTIKRIFKNKDIRKIYLANFMLQFFYSWMVVYMPIYLNQHLGFSWDKIGIIFMIMLLPFVLIEYPLGKISDRIGEKKILACHSQLPFKSKSNYDWHNLVYNPRRSRHNRSDDGKLFLQAHKCSRFRFDWIFQKLFSSCICYRTIACHDILHLLPFQIYILSPWNHYDFKPAKHPWIEQFTTRKHRKHKSIKTPEQETNRLLSFKHFDIIKNIINNLYKTYETRRSAKHKNK
ncbi:MAG: hypothetical protein US50_C0006G0002 [Candidatus Nomurabacteria bacterium GW2011_GWB1_37_5]|uniref:Major facilitator superfamily (MFS) profile domain-containing protein n=1 Tax=Candidatus Nomurabacteria bacterium GW2011_GWB1_37_5 TaxID=1618742 RepID=A0A0G0JG26_9BACT|nr:MAG: hypothetical protein US50_C0006G0002 [Candidatus Nomurabacteria bacterium GW2011_GWB1_37_5]